MRKPTLSQGEDPRAGTSLAATTQSAPPEREYPIAKKTTRLVRIPRHRVVVEIALYDRPEPSAGLGHGIVHARAKLLPNLSQLAMHFTKSPT